jgi:acyl carrier protein
MSKVRILQEVYEHLKTSGLSIPLSSFGELNLSEIDSLQLATLMLDFESKYRTSFSIDFLDSINQKNVNDLVSILSGEE